MAFSNEEECTLRLGFPGGTSDTGLASECLCITVMAFLPVSSNKLKGLNGSYLDPIWENTALKKEPLS